jgi:hypothetical protein
MKPLAIALSVALLAAQLVNAQPPKVYCNDQKFGKGKITIVEQLTVVKDGLPKVVVDEKGVCSLSVTSWVCGRCFVDDAGRQWCLAQGEPVAEKPAFMNGWCMKGEAGQTFLLHESGSLYRLSGQPVPIKPIGIEKAPAKPKD